MFLFGGSKVFLGSKRGKLVRLDTRESFKFSANSAGGPPGICRPLRCVGLQLLRGRGFGVQIWPAPNNNSNLHPGEKKLSSRFEHLEMSQQSRQQTLTCHWSWSGLLLHHMCKRVEHPSMCVTIALPAVNHMTLHPF